MTSSVVHYALTASLLNMFNHNPTDSHVAHVAEIYTQLNM